jgi:ribosomal protein S12 methylthiotransferase accessory factor
MNLFGQAMTARKHFFDGTHRTRPPAETLADYRRFLPMMGITRIANVTGLDRIGLPVCVAIRPNARSLATSQGKGETLAAARASAMMEAIESWHGERIAGPLWSESYAALATHRRVIDPRLLAIRADATWHADRPLEWIEGEDLMTGEPAWVPHETISSNFVEMTGRRPVFLKGTNGLASGNHLLEAVLHGMFEVIERDALTLWSLQPADARKARQVDLASIGDEHLQRTIHVLAEKGVAAAAWDITSDLGIPTFTCTLIDDPDSPQWRPIPAMSGHGTHLHPRIALSRALHEAIQSRVTMISGSRDDMFPRDYDDAGDRGGHARILDEWRVPPPALPFRRGDTPVSEWFEQDIAIVLERLRARGLTSVVVVDLTVAGVDIPVVKVVIPGTEPVRTGVYRPGPRARQAMARRAA